VAIGAASGSLYGVAYDWLCGRLIGVDEPAVTTGLTGAVIGALIGSVVAPVYRSRKPVHSDLYTLVGFATGLVPAALLLVGGLLDVTEFAQPRSLAAVAFGPIAVAIVVGGLADRITSPFLTIGDSGKGGTTRVSDS